MKNTLLTFVLVAASAVAFAQAPATPAAKPAAQSAPATKPAAKAAPVEQDQVLTPKEINLGGSKIPGDSAVQADIGVLNQIAREYDDTKKATEQKYTQLYQSKFSELQKDIQLVKNENNWDDTVELNLSTAKWTKLTKAEYEAKKKQAVPVAPAAKPAVPSVPPPAAKK